MAGSSSAGGGGAGLQDRAGEPKVGLHSEARRVYTTRMASRLVGAAGVALLGLLALGCDTAKPAGPPTASRVAVGSGDCAGKIRAMDLANDATVFAVDSCLFTL